MKKILQINAKKKVKAKKINLEKIYQKTNVQKFIYFFEITRNGLHFSK